LPVDDQIGEGQPDLPAGQAAPLQHRLAGLDAYPSAQLDLQGGAQVSCTGGSTGTAIAPTHRERHSRDCAAAPHPRVRATNGCHHDRPLDDAPHRCCGGTLAEWSLPHRASHTDRPALTACVARFAGFAGFAGLQEHCRPIAIWRHDGTLVSCDGWPRGVRARSNAPSQVSATVHIAAIMRKHGRSTLASRVIAHRWSG